jgi:cytochrome P450 family 6
LDPLKISCSFTETLRKYPPATSIIRQVSKDYAVADTSVVLPKGTQVFVPVYAIHHDPELYPDPEVYDPDRFSTENEKKRPACSFIPFGDGPRHCIGMRFGLMQVRVGLAMLLNNFRFKIAEKTKMPLEFESNTPLLQLKGDIWLKIEKI